MSEVRKQWNGGRSRIVMPPAPGWDVEGTESWLFDMEKAGWRLAKNGFFLGLARFERVEPGEAVYRLDAAQTRRSLWDDRGGEPDEDAKALAAACGGSMSRPGDSFMSTVRRARIGSCIRTRPSSPLR